MRCVRTRGILFCFVSTILGWGVQKVALLTNPLLTVLSTAPPVAAQMTAGSGAQKQQPEGRRGGAETPSLRPSCQICAGRARRFVHIGSWNHPSQLRSSRPPGTHTTCAANPYAAQRVAAQRGPRSFKPVHHLFCLVADLFSAVVIMGHTQGSVGCDWRRSWRTSALRGICPTEAATTHARK